MCEVAVWSIWEDIDPKTLHIQHKLYFCLLILTAPKSLFIPLMRIEDKTCKMHACIHAAKFLWKKHGIFIQYLRKIIRNFHAACNFVYETFMQNIVKTHQELFREVFIHYLITTKLLKLFESSSQTVRSKNKLSTKLWRTFNNYGVYARSELGNTSFRPPTIWFSFFLNFYGFLSKLRSEITEISFFNLMRNISCIWYLSRSTKENPWNE